MPLPARARSAVVEFRKTVIPHPLKIYGIGGVVGTHFPTTDGAITQSKFKSCPMPPFLWQGVLQPAWDHDLSVPATSLMNKRYESNTTPKTTTEIPM